MRVLVVGHSQVPRVTAGFDGHEVEWCRLGGADLRDVETVNARLGRALTSHRDIIFLFLGGNDIFRYSKDENTKNLRDTIHRFRALCSLLYVIKIEQRDYRNSPNPSWRARWQYYQTECNRLNNLIKRHQKTYGFRTINLGSHNFQGRNRDGVHLNFIGRNHLYLKIKLAVKHRVEELAAKAAADAAAVAAAGNI